MLERFTERARRSMSLARQEALRSSHEFIDSGHILLGLLAHGEGVAVRVLITLQVDPKRVREAVEALHAPVPSASVHLKQLPFSADAKRSLELAGEAASVMGHQVIGTEHLLLGILRENEGIAAQALLGLGLEAGRVQETILAVLGADPVPPRPSDVWNLRPHAVAIRPLTDRPSVQGPLTALLQQGKSIALVGPKRVGKTSSVLAMARAKAAGLAYRSVDHHVFDEFHGRGFSSIRQPDSVCFIAQAELLTVSRSVNANLLEDRMTAGERLILEFRDADLEKFAARYNFIAKDLVTVEVKPPDADECRQLLESARARLKESTGLDVPDDVLREADRLARDRWRLLVPPWQTITTLWAAESIHRETSARGDEEQMVQDIAELERSNPEQAELLKRHLEGLRSIAGSNALSIESVRRAMGELSGQSQ